MGCFSPLPTFMIAGNAKLHPDESKDENSSFPVQLRGPLASTHGCCGAWGTHRWRARTLPMPVRALLSDLASHHHSSAHRTVANRPLAHLLFEHDELSPSSGSCFRFSPWNTLPLGHCMVFLSCLLYLSVHQPLWEGCPDQAHLSIHLPAPPCCVFLIVTSLSETTAFIYLSLCLLSVSLP